MNTIRVSVFLDSIICLRRYPQNVATNTTDAAIISPPKSLQNAPLAQDAAKRTHRSSAGLMRDISLKQFSAFSTFQPLSATSQLIRLNRHIFSKLMAGLEVDSENTLRSFSVSVFMEILTWRGIIVISAFRFHVCAIRPTFCSRRAHVAPLRK